MMAQCDSVLLALMACEEAIRAILKQDVKAIHRLAGEFSSQVGYKCHVVKRCLAELQYCDRL